MGLKSEDQWLLQQRNQDYERGEQGQKGCLSNAQTHSPPSQVSWPLIDSDHFLSASSLGGIDSTPLHCYMSTLISYNL
jgi:hypothetical protein